MIERMAEVTEYQWAAVRRISQDHYDSTLALRRLGPSMPSRVDAGVHSESVANIVKELACSIANLSAYVETIGDRVDEALTNMQTMEDVLTAEFTRFANGGGGSV